MKRISVILLVVCILAAVLSDSQTKTAQTSNTSNQVSNKPTTSPISNASITDLPVFDKTTTIICPWGVGGSTDTNARAIGSSFSSLAKENIRIVNYTGNSGIIGTTAQISASPDGSFLGIITAELNTLPAQGLTDLTYKDLYPLIRLNTLPACIAVPADAPYDTLEDFISYAKKHPGELKTGNVGTGSVWNISAVKLERATDIKLEHVSFPSGASSAISDLLSGTLDLVTLGISVCHQYVITGDLKILAVMSKERLASFPDYPTCSESGYDVVFGSYQGIVCPIDVPDETKNRLENLLTDAYNTDEYQEFCDSYGLEKSYLNSADFQVFLEEDFESMKQVMEDLNLF